MQWWWLGLVALVAYLLGSVNGSLLVSQTFLKIDIRRYGSGNAGTTNALRIMGKKWAVLVTLLDLGKGAAAVGFGYLLLQGAGSGDVGRLLAGVFCILGHIFPVFYRFKGGKGVMTTAAVVACVDWRVCLAALALFALVVLVTRWVSLGSLLAAAAVPAGMYLSHRGEGREALVLTALSAVITLLIAVMHRDNIKRLLSGTERRFSFKGKAMMDTVKTRTKSLTRKTGAALRQTSKRLRVKGSARRLKGRKVSRRKLRKAKRKSEARSQRAERRRRKGKTQRKTAKRRQSPHVQQAG
ncbi:MAG: glycerol-3-phosphate 1-O-acyltransferase PlsY [Oscillospiraceae bacterium]|jgi:glycerol-3-phosphate acyltransferase PlsY|nr:glycerol-3-phosphate 1-O-acyltransferase PlsY [Oscillospiraceae bacterium]